jgi:hypothetical protein
MAPKKNRKPVQESLVEKPTPDFNVPFEAIREEEQEDSEDQENHDDHENEEEQPTMVLFTSEQLEVLLKMNRPNFSDLVVALKGGSSKGVGFQPAKPRNFDGVQDRKVINVWLTKMEDYIHATKVRQHLAVELAQSYLKGYASTWWKTVKQEEGKNHGYTWEFFKEHIELEFIPKNSNYMSRYKLHDLVNATNDNLRQYAKAYSEFMLEIRHMHE